MDRGYGFLRGLRGKLISQDFLLAVSMGLVGGFSIVEKFGRTNAMPLGTTKLEIWGVASAYVFDIFGTAPIVSLISSSTSDVGQPIKVTGLDINGDEVFQTVNTNGTNRVALTTPLWRVYRMENEADEGGDLVGTLYCYTGTSTGGAPPVANQRAVIVNGDNQTEMCMYTVPRGKVAFLLHKDTGMYLESAPASTGEFCRFSLRQRKVGKVSKIKKSMSTISNGASNFEDAKVVAEAIPALTDVYITSAQRSVQMGVWASYDLLIVDDSKFLNSFLQSIGQPA